MMNQPKIKQDISNMELSISIIDDNPDDRTLAIRELKKEFNNISINEITNRSELDEILEHGDFDLVITDYRLRWTTGLEVLKKIKSQYPDIPVIMFTGTGTEEVAVEAMKIGLEDYVVKSPKHFMRLPVSVKRAIEQREEQKEAEEAVKKSELKYKAIFENTGTKSFIFDGNDIIEIVNNQFEKMSGYSRDEIAGKASWKEFVVEEDYEKFMEFISSAKEKEESSPEYFSVEFVNRYNDKRNVLTSLNTIPETDKLVCSMLDITKFKETMEALTASEEMFRVAFEDSPIGIMLISLNYEILEVNRSLCDLFDLSEGDLIKRKCDEIIPQNEFSKLKETLDELKDKDLKKIKQRIEFDIKDGLTFNVVLSIIENPKGEPTYYLIHVYD
ncbi:MAG: PAS domain S-box protein [Thermoplasmatota archaeon]